jgi:hypothetical protein
MPVELTDETCQLPSHVHIVGTLSNAPNGASAELPSRYFSMYFLINESVAEPPAPCAIGTYSSVKSNITSDSRDCRVLSSAL